MAQLRYVVRKRLRIRWPILLAYALCFGTAHIIGAVFAWSVVATLALMFMFGAVVWAVLVDVAPDHTKRPKVTAHAKSHVNAPVLADSESESTGGQR